MRVNGKFIPLEKVQTLFDFLQTRSVDTSTIAVERNGEIVPRADYKKVILYDEDTLEIVKFVGGG